MPDRAEHIDQHFAAQQFINFIHTSRMLSGHAFDRGFFVCAVVIDMDIWINTAALHDHIDEVFKRPLLFRRFHGPSRLVNELILAIRYRQHAKEIFQPTLKRELIAFEVKKDIARRWRGK